MVTPEIVSERLLTLRREVPEGINLVAVSKFQPVELLMGAYRVGQRLFGESRVQELLEKIPLMPSDVQWHFIGHLQTNKVKSLIGKTELIQSVDSERLLKIIDEESRKASVSTDVLLQVHVAAEETKFGFSPEELRIYFRNRSYETLTNTRICGLMAMATNTENEQIIRDDFARVSRLFREVSEITGFSIAEFKTLSMGMSGDWPIAVEEGATLIRVGSTIFGPRN